MATRILTLIAFLLAVALAPLPAAAQDDFAAQIDALGPGSFADRTKAMDVLVLTGDERVPPPGTVLTRVYRGQAYHVVVHEDGFEYDGQIFRSLSAIAKLITGSHWNGLLFFKLAKPKVDRASNTAIVPK